MHNFLDVALAPAADALAFLLCGWSFVLLRKGQPGRAVWWLVGAAAIFRLAASFQFALNPWDERLHALVATRMAEDPLRPMLYADPVRPFEISNWLQNHIWLHKPPVTLWLMGAAAKIFGRNEFAIRLPTVALTSCEPLLVYSIALSVVNPLGAWLAAFFSAINGFLIELASGRAATDHTDALMNFFVTFGVCLGFRAVSTNSWKGRVGSGLVTGLSVLTKWWAGLIVVPVVGIVQLAKQGLLRALVGAAVITAAAAALILPWEIFTRLRYPEEVKVITLEHLTHFSDNLGHPGGPLFHFQQMPRIFGLLVYLAVLYFTWLSFRKPAPEVGSRKLPAAGLALLVWFLVPYFVFSLAAAKMSGLVMLASAPVFVMLGAFGEQLVALRARVQGRGGRVLTGFALCLLVGAPVQYTLERTKAFRRQDLFPAFSADLKALGNEVRPLPRVVIFHAPMPIDTMFYAKHSAYADMPSEAELSALEQKGYLIYFYRPGADLPPAWRQHPQVRVWEPALP